MLGWLEQKSFPQPDRENEGSNGCLQVLARKQYKISTAACKHLMGGVCPQMGCALAVVDACPKSESKELQSPGGQRGMEAQAAHREHLGAQWVRWGSPLQGWSRCFPAQAPLWGAGVLFLALMHPRAAA